MATAARSPPAGVTEAPPARRTSLSGRVRSGCITCKSRKKKCDERYSGDPSCCESCSRLGLICEREALRKVPPRPSRRRKPPSTVPPPAEGNTHLPPQTALPIADSVQPHPFMSIYSSKKTSTERLLLKYYVGKLAALCSIVPGESNGFVTVLLPMAMDDLALLYALFTYASVHLSITAHQTAVSATAQLEYQSEAARTLSEDIGRNTVSDSSIACALICCAADFTNGDTERWILHLRGAGQLISMRGGAERLGQTSDGRFLLRNFAYHDILSAVSSGGRPHMNGVYWNRDSEPSMDALMGIADGLFGLISEVCTLIADVKDSLLSEDLTCDHISRGETLAHRLRVQLCTPPTPSAGADWLTLSYHAEAYRYASLLLLYHLMSDLSPVYLLEISECVEKIVYYASVIPPDSTADAGLVFPLFMAGVGAVFGGPIDFIRERLNSIYNRTKFGHIAKVLELLENMWSMGRTDWVVLLDELGWKISLA